MSKDGEEEELTPEEEDEGGSGHRAEADPWVVRSGADDELNLWEFLLITGTVYEYWYW